MLFGGGRRAGLMLFMVPVQNLAVIVILLDTVSHGHSLITTEVLGPPSTSATTTVRTVNGGLCRPTVQKLSCAGRSAVFLSSCARLQEYCYQASCVGFVAVEKA